jgi:hypothetical protein
MTWCNLQKIMQIYLIAMFRIISKYSKLYLEFFSNYTLHLTLFLNVWKLHKYRKRKITIFYQLRYYNKQRFKHYSNI